PRAARPGSEVVDEDFDRPEILLSLVDGSFAALFCCDVGYDSESIDLSRDSLHVGFGSSDDRNAGALARQRLGDAETDAFRRSRDQGDLALDAEVHASRILDRCCRPLRSTKV